MKILGMGNALVDVLALINDDSSLEKLNLPKGSMQLIDEQKLKEINQSIAGLEKHLASGGSASNTIIGMARMGADAGFIGRVGNDTYGQYFENDLVKNGVIPHLTVVNETSGIATTFISKDGERTFGTYLGAAALLAPENLNRKDFEGYHYFYIEGYLVQNLELISRAIKLAKEAGSKIILDLASYNVVESNFDFLSRIIPESVDILFANEEESSAFTGKNPETAVSELAKIVDISIVKEGSKGSWIQRGVDKVHVPALKVNCIDTTGAGDVYASGFLYGLMNNKDLKSCGEYGTRLAGQVVQHIGAKIQEDGWGNIKSDLKMN